jgi:hypothetical protein
MVTGPLLSSAWTVRGRGWKQRYVVLLTVILVLSSMLAYTAAQPRPVLANSGPATQLAFTVNPTGSYTADDTISVTVEVQDAEGARVDEGPDSTATVVLEFTGPTATVEGTLVQDAIDGVATFSDLAVRTVGSDYGLDVSSGTLAGASSTAFAITHGAATTLDITSGPSGSYTADDEFGVTVEVLDGYGNLVDDSTATIALTHSGGGSGATLEGDASNDAVGGVATFADLAVRKVGTGNKLTAGSGSLTTDDTDLFAITHGAATKLVVTTDPNGTYTADANNIAITVTVQDAWSNTVTTGAASTASVSLALSGGSVGAVLLGTNPKSASNGVVTFDNLSVRKVGTAYKLTASSGTLATDDTTTFNITPGALASFTVVTSGATQVAGVAFNVTATAYDAWGNIKTDYVGPASVTGDLSTSLGVGNGAGDDHPPTYVQFSNAVWPGGVRTTQVTAFVAESGRTITVSQGTPTGLSNLFTVNPANAASVAFSVGSSDTAAPFTFSPITTKVGTPIYSVCTPPAVPQVNPCALTPGSTSVRALVRDQYGNRILQQTVTITRNGSATPLSAASTVNGVADFGDSLSIAAVGNYTLTASVTSGLTNPLITAPIAIVNDLEACDGQACDNNTSNGAQQLQKAFGKITTGADFYNGSTTNVRLSTQFVPGSETNRCGSNKTIGDATDLRVDGLGVGVTTPATTMVLVIPKDTLKAYGITSRGTASFNVCLGALNISGGSVTPWKAKNPNLKKSGLVDSSLGFEDRYWGVPADCGTAGLPIADPCIGLRSKQAATVQAYLGMSNAQFASLGIKDSDLVIIIEKKSPWDGKGGTY